MDDSVDMDDDDFRALIVLLSAELEAVGEADIADERHYVEGSEDSPGEAVLLAPREHLVAMLKAFERFLAVQDRETYNRSLADMNEVLTDGGPRAAFVETAGSRPEVNPVQLSDAPELASLRDDVTSLIGNILESGDGRPRSGS